MATVGSVIAALQGLDPWLPIGALRVERQREVTDFEVGDVVEVHVEHDRGSGEPLAAWVVVGLSSAAAGDVLRRAVPRAWTVVREGCGCVIPVDVVPGRRVVTLAVSCPHHQPGRVGQALAAAVRRDDPSDHS